MKLQSMWQMALMLALQVRSESDVDKLLKKNPSQEENKKLTEVLVQLVKDKAYDLVEFLLKRIEKVEPHNLDRYIYYKDYYTDGQL